jgi:CRP/FNR family transcriptional regulator, cyclic AMP receptor protein
LPANVALLTLVDQLFMLFAMDKAAAACIAESTGWLSRQPEEFRAEVIRRSHLRRFEAGEILYHAGDPPGGVYGLVEGVLTVTLPAGQIVTVKRPGFWVGETAAMRRQNRVITLSVVARSDILYLPLAEFERMIGDPAHCRLFATMSIEHLDEALSIIGYLMANDPTVRVAGRLLTLAEAQAIPEGSAMRLTQSDLAQMCGVSRQTVNKVLTGLSVRNVIAAKYGMLTILDARHLRFLAGEVA